MKAKRAPQLGLCRACQQFIKSHELDCPHCGADILEAALSYREKMEKAQTAAQHLEALIAQLAAPPAK